MLSLTMSLVWWLWCLFAVLAGFCFGFGWWAAGRLTSRLS